MPSDKRRPLSRITQQRRPSLGHEPALVLSDDPGASGWIARFADSGDRWLVAVCMVSEGVDVPRLAVGVYATSASTPLYFAHAVGRFACPSRCAWSRRMPSNTPMVTTLRPQPVRGCLHSAPALHARSLR